MTPAQEQRLREALETIVRVASGECQVADDDTAGMAWIDKVAREALLAEGQPAMKAGQSDVALAHSSFKGGASMDTREHTTVPKHQSGEHRADSRGTSAAAPTRLGAEKPGPVTPLMMVEILGLSGRMQAEQAVKEGRFLNIYHAQADRLNALLAATKPIHYIAFATAEDAQAASAILAKAAPVCSGCLKSDRKVTLVCAECIRAICIEARQRERESIEAAVLAHPGERGEMK